MSCRLKKRREGKAASFPSVIAVNGLLCRRLGIPMNLSFEETWPTGMCSKEGLDT